MAEIVVGKPLILDLNEPPPSEDDVSKGAGDVSKGPAFPAVRKAYWRSATWVPARGGSPNLQRTASSGKGTQRLKSSEQDSSGLGKGKGLRIQVENGWKGDVEVIKLSEAQAPKPSIRTLMPGMHLDLGGLHMNGYAEPTEIQIKRSKFAFFEKHCSKVAEHVYLGSDVVARNREILRESGITHVLNCVGFVCPEYFVGELTYKTLWLQDIPGEDLLSVLYDVFDYLEEVRIKKGRVLVHCCQGVSRSTSLVIAYLMWRENRPFDDTFQDVKDIRGTANPNMGFACQLLQWQKRITWGTESEAPPHSGRMYRIAPHTAFCPLYLVPKPVNKARASELDRRGVFVVDAPSGEVFVWVGEEASPSMAAAGGKVAAQIMRYERAKGPLTVVKQGQEEARFWEALSLEGGEDEHGATVEELERSSPSEESPAVVGTVSAYDADFELFRRAESGEIKPTVPGSSSVPGAVSRETKTEKLEQVSAESSSEKKETRESQKSSEWREDTQPPERKTAPRKQAQPEVFLPSVSRSYPVSTLPPPSPSLPPPNKRSKSPTTAEQSAEILSPPPPSPSSSMGSFYKQHRVLSPRPVPEIKPGKSPSLLGLEASRRKSLLANESESRPPWLAAPESTPPNVPIPDWGVPESPRVQRRTSFPGFMSVRSNETEDPQTPGAVPSTPRGPRNSSKAEEKKAEKQGFVEEQPPKAAPKKASELSEGLSASLFLDESRPTESWAARRPVLKITGGSAVKADDAPVSPVGPLPGAEVLSPGSEETGSLVTERLPPTAKKVELLLDEGEAVESRDSPMDVDRRRSLEKGRRSSRLSGGKCPRLFEAPLFQEIEMFDTDDLHSESAYALLVNSDAKKEVYVWLGGDYAKQESDRRVSIGSAMSTDSASEEKDGHALGEDFLRSQGLPLETLVTVVEEGKESDKFWSHFVNG